MVNQNKVEEAVKLFLEAIGEDPERDGLRETPERIGRMCKELFAGMDADPSVHLSKTFPVNDDTMVIERDIQFYSLCEHHLLPFYGKANIAYIPDGKVVGLSKLARCVEVYARRAQIQERMTAQIADAVMEILKPKGVMVLTEAEHMCMTMRGVQKPGSSTTAMAIRGCFTENEHLQDMFFHMLQKSVPDQNDEPFK